MAAPPPRATSSCGAATSTSRWSSATPSSSPARSATWCSAATSRWPTSRASYDGLKAAGVKVVQGEVTAIDAAGKKVRLADGGELPYDRLVLSPGIDFMTEQIGGLPAALASGRVLHSWKAGPQTVALAQADRGHARRRRVRDVHPQGALPLPARALRARLHGGQLPEDGQAEVEGAGAGRQRRDHSRRRGCSRRPSRTTTPASSSTGRMPS